MECPLRNSTNSATSNCSLVGEGEHQCVRVVVDGEGVAQEGLRALARDDVGVRAEELGEADERDAEEGRGGLAAVAGEVAEDEAIEGGRVHRGNTHTHTRIRFQTLGSRSSGTTCVAHASEKPGSNRERSGRQSRQAERFQLFPGLEARVVLEDEGVGGLALVVHEPLPAPGMAEEDGHRGQGVQLTMRAAVQGLRAGDLDEVAGEE